MDIKEFIDTFSKHAMLSLLSKDKRIEIFNKLEKRGYDLKFLGSGSNGIAFDIKHDKVLKITTDNSEANSMSIIVNKKLKNVVEVFTVWKFRYIDDVYFIEQEKLEPVDKEFVGKILKLSIFYKDKLYITLGEITSYIIGDEGIDMIKEKINDYKTKEKKIMLDMLNASLELRSIGINFHDWHSNNILQKNGIYKIVDIGLSKSPKQNIPIIEKLNLKTILKQIEHKIENHLCY